MTSSSPPLLPARIALAAAASGAAALVYQMGWLRLLIFSVGATWPAITVVLAGFMAGLGVGAHLGGRHADTRDERRLVRIYVALELTILLSGVAVGLLAPALAHLPFPALGVLSGRVLAAGLLVAVPATAMGATSPVLAVLCARRLADASGAPGTGGAYVPLLYAVNAAGAVAGTLAGGLWLPFTLGLPGMLALAAGLNVVAALAVGTMPGAEPAAPRDAVPEGPTATDGVPLGTLAVLSLGSGLLSLGAETVWTRSLAQIDATLYDGRWLQPGDVLAVVLAQVLFGQAVGGVLAASRAVHTTSAPGLLRWLGALLVLGGVLSLATLEAVSVQLSRTTIVQEAPSWGLALRLLLVLPAGIAFGTSFPLLGALVARSGQQLGRRFGALWAVNTAGTVAGSLLAGAVVIPYLGSGRGVLGAAGLAVALGGTALVWAQTPGQARGWDRVWIGGAVGVLAAVGFGVSVQPGRALALKYGESAVIAAWEGWEATTVVAQPPSLPRGIVTNGHAILGNVPYASRAAEIHTIAPHARRGLIVGFGTGNFARSVLRAMHLDQLTIVEIDGFQFRAARLFGTETVITDPKVDTVVDDALHYLTVAEGHTWDLIALDAWGPDRSPSLYTTEMHERAMAHLAPGGLFWAKLVTIDENSERAILDAARCTWPYTWVHAPPDLGIFASREDREMPPTVRRLPPADATCSPHSRLYPVRVRATMEVGSPPR